MDNNSSLPINWNRLCRNISEKNVIPVIGNEMYKFNLAGNLVNIESYVVKELLRNNGIEDRTFKSIGAAVDYLLVERQADIRDINDDLKSLTSSETEYPLLNEFLAIGQLLFYVNTTVYGNILESIIQRQRNSNAIEGNFSIYESFTENINVNALERPFVFNIFGSLAHNVVPALKEEEMLEFTTALIGKISDSKFASILDALKNKTLLFLGCSQPGWLIRFLFRILSNDRIDNWQRRRSEIIVINDKSDEREVQFRFLSSYKAITYDGDTNEFVRELSDKWKEYSRIHPPKPKNIFISYSHKDTHAAETLLSRLSGIENVNCWFDNNRLQSGDNFNTEIILNIDSADLFIPIISANSLEGDNSYVRREWLTAYNTNVTRMIRNKKAKYLLPVVIDNTNLGNSVINEFFPSLTIASIPGGNADDQFINTVKKELELA